MGLTPLLPIGGSFDTFGAMDAWFRPLLDVDSEGNAYVAIWASPRRIQRHAATFADHLSPLSSAPDSALDSDILLTRVDRSGARVWSRVVGTAHEDEPYAIRAASDSVAVVGRARRNPGFDNTFWDAFISVSSPQGEPLGTRVLHLNDSSILLGVDRLGDAGWVVGGSDGWAQNPRSCPARTPQGPTIERVSPGGVSSRDEWAQGVPNGWQPRPEGTPCPASTAAPPGRDCPPPRRPR